MNLQDIIFPIRDFLLWTFEVLKAGGNNFNHLIEISMFIAALYWIFKLVGFQKDEVLNR